MRPVYSVQRPVTPTPNVLAAKSALAVNVVRNVILALVQPDSCVRMELVLPAAVPIWIVPAIDRVSMDNAWIPAYVTMPVERMLSVKCLNTERFACVPTDSKVNQSKDVQRTNVKPMTTANTTNNVTMDPVRILAYNPALVASMLSAALLIVMRNALVHRDIMEILRSNVLHKSSALVPEILAVKMQDVAK